MLSRNLFLGTISFLVILVYHSMATSADPAQSYDILYHQAVEAYLVKSHFIILTFKFFKY